MKTFKCKKMLLFCLIGICLFVVVKLILLFTLTPKPTVDYIAKYNQYTKPEDYDPAQNAFEDYQKSFDAFVAMPETLRKRCLPLPKPAAKWPSEFNADEFAMLEQWIISNSESFKHFKDAADKPYCWIERKNENGEGMYGVVFSELGSLGDLVSAQLWNAKLNAFQGHLRNAFNGILTVYKAGQHKCRKTLFVTEQFDGLHIQNDAVQTVLLILSKSSAPKEDIQHFIDALKQQLMKEKDYIPGVQSEKLCFLDVIQRVYINKRSGNGRMAWRVSDHTSNHSELSSDAYGLKHRLYLCLFGPTQNDIVRDYDRVINLSEGLMCKTPWLLNFEKHDDLKIIENINNKYSILNILGFNPKPIISYYYKTQAQADALIAVLAAMLYKADSGHFPESLDTLFPGEYLKGYPIDPYDNGPLKYRLTKDNFILYSVGEDFTDNGGIVRMIEKPMPPTFPDMKNPHIVKPSQKMIPYKYYTDNIYWPVNNKH